MQADGWYVSSTDGNIAPVSVEVKVPFGIRFMCRFSAFGMNLKDFGFDKILDWSVGDGNECLCSVNFVSVVPNGFRIIFIKGYLIIIKVQRKGYLCTSLFCPKIRTENYSLNETSSFYTPTLPCPILSFHLHDLVRTLTKSVVD